MKKALDVLERILLLFMTGIIIVFTALVAAQVVSRYIFNNSITWSEQAARYLFIWMILLGMPILYRHKEHVRFDMIQERFPEKTRDVLKIVIDILVIAFAIFYGYWAIKYCIAIKGKLMIGLGLSQVYVYAAQPVGAFLLMIFAADSAVDELKALLKKKKEA